MVICFYFLAIKLHPKNVYLTRFLPVFIGVLNYFAHTKFINYYHFVNDQNAIDRNKEVIMNNPSEPLSSQIMVDLNDIFRHIILFGSLLINHMYIDIYLTVTHTDSLILNINTWGLLSLNAIFHQCKYNLN